MSNTEFIFLSKKKTVFCFDFAIKKNKLAVFFLLQKIPVKNKKHLLPKKITAIDCLYSLRVPLAAESSLSSQMRRYPHGKKRKTSNHRSLL